MSWRALVLSLMFSSLVGCMVPPGGSECVAELQGDAGADGGFEGCEPLRSPGDDVPLSADAGTEAAPAADVEFVECYTLVDDACGAGDPPPCEDAAGCAAAKLLAQYEPGACAEALVNDVTYPDCRPGSCALLVDRVCGGPSDDAKCAEAPGCDPAKELQVRSSSSDAQERSDAESSCNAALEDDVVFAPCE